MQLPTASADCRCYLPYIVHQLDDIVKEKNRQTSNLMCKMR